jgi:hypothetical protein
VVATLTLAQDKEQSDERDAEIAALGARPAELEGRASPSPLPEAPPPPSRQRRRWLPPGRKAVGLHGWSGSR